MGGEMAPGKRLPGASSEQLLDLRVDDMNDEGFGVAETGGRETWIPGAFPGERVRARPRRGFGEILLADLIEVLEPDAARTRSGPACEPGCAGCPFLQLKYSAQLRFKQERVREALRQVPNARSLIILPIRPADPLLGYRATAKLSVSVSGRQAKVGLFRWGTHTVETTTRCPTHHPLVNAIAEAITLELERQPARRGASPWLRHVVIRVSPALTRAMVTFVVTRRDRALVTISKGLQRRIPEVVSIHENLNQGSGPLVFGPETRKLWGYPDLLDQVGERRVLLSPTSFFQAHHGQAAWIYELVRQWAGLRVADSAVDVYCGVGGITMALARDAGQVTGVEASRDAVRDARRNAELNSLDNCRFRVADAARLTEALRVRDHPAAVTLNPPRAGAGARVLEQVASLKPSRLVYVSCNPETLAADIRRLAGLGFIPLEAQPVDMFPQTPHVETVVRFGPLE